MYKSINILLLSLFLLALIPKPSYSQAMSNDNFIIRTENINQATPSTLNQGNSSKTLDEDLKSDSIEGVNFKTEAGFENANQLFPFTIALSSSLIDFGKLNPTNPLIRTAIFSVQGLPTHGYSVIALADHPLQKDDISIPDTTCDNGGCTHEDAQEWINTLTYGFGYRCDNLTGADCHKSFVNANYYKQFPNAFNSHSPYPIIKGVGSKNIEAKLSYKINISVNMPDNTYSNKIFFIAVPNF